MPKGEYTEPHLILLRDLQPGGNLHEVMPDAVMDLAIEMYKRKRSGLSQDIGALELAWSRGFQAGRWAAVEALRRLRRPGCAKLLKEHYHFDEEGTIGL